MMISVIVPVYNVEPYIRRCVDSILAQSFSDFELILVDDGSPDNCGKICDEYAEKDDRVHVIHQENGGLSAARNAGIDYAFANSDSKWLTFIDSDDWIHPKTLELLYNAAIENNVSVSCCGYARTDGENPDVDDAKCIPQILSPEEFYTDKNVEATVAWGKVYAKDCFKEIRYPAGKLHEDEFTTYKILFRYDKISYIDAPLYAYFNNQNGIILSKWTPKRLDALDAIEGQIEFFYSHNYISAGNKAFLNYIYIVRSIISQIKENQLIIYLTDVRSRGKKTLKKCQKYIDLPYSEYEWVYEMLYPSINYTNAILRKLKLKK